MILYHGSNVCIDKIDLSKCRPYKDFGKGFYLTDIKEQAIFMAQRTFDIYGGEKVLNMFEIEDGFLSDTNLRIKNFTETPTEEWAMFVMNNRNRKFKDFSSLACNHDNKYDIVHGPVADDSMAVLFQQYERNLITLEMLKNGLTYKKLSMQFSFHTQKAILLLKKVETIYG